MDTLTSRLRAEPEQALAELYERYTGLVYACVKSVLAGFPREEIEECVLDAFSYVYERRNALDFEKGSVKAYLCVTAKNKAIDRLRRLSRQRVVPLSEAERVASPACTEADAIAAAGLDALVSEIRALGEPDATLLLYRYYFRMSTREIAALLHMKENTIDQRIRRAKAKLTKRLKGAIPHEA